MTKKILLFFIRIYQKTISPDHGVFSDFCNTKNIGCRYFPSCSEYMYQSIQKNGISVGVLKGTLRVMRCNPFTTGGYDPVTKEKSKKT